jgi:Tol biopolymer transport system component
LITTLIGVFFVPEINGHPLWLPDGRRIVFWLTRGGHRQIWGMNGDGGNAHSLNATGYDDWNSVWVK